MDEYVKAVVNADTSREALIGKLANVLCNAGNFPPKVAPHILGQNMMPLMSMVADVVIERDRVVAANAWDECKKELWSEIRQLPSWTDPANGHTEFDLQPLGPDTTSEYGARELIVDIFEETSNPYRITEENN